MDTSSTSSNSKALCVKTRSGAADTDGVDYENCMHLLILLRLLEDENVKDFYIAKNVDELGAFDDLVIKVEYATPPGETKLILVQLKHFQNKDKTIVSTELSNVENKRGKFQLKKYFDSYETIISNIGKFKNEILNDCSVENMTFVLFTNAKFSIGDKSIRSSSFCYWKLLETGDEESNIFGIDSSKQFGKLHSEMENNKNPVIQEENGFLQKMVIFSEQSNVKQLKNILKDKIKDYIGADKVPIEFALQMGLNFIIKNSSKWLSRHSEIFAAIEFLYQGIALKLSEAEHFWTTSITRKILVKHICRDVENGAISVGKDMERSDDYYVNRSLSKKTKGKRKMSMEEEWTLKILKAPLVLICGTPGMGKSSFFTRQAELIKAQNPEKYVIRKNLVSFSKYFRNMNVEGNAENAARMFLEEISGVSPGTLEYEMFDYSLRAKDMMVIFLDGVDEISPNYYCKLLVVIQTIQEKFQVQLFVSTRPVVKERMENDLRVVHWQLDKFQNKDVDLFFEKYCNIHADDSHTVLNYADGELFSLPIYCRMLGDIIHNSSEQDAAESFKNVFNKSQIFDKFVDVMFEAYYRDKVKIDGNTPGGEDVMKMNQHIVLEQYEKFALLEIFEKDELQILDENIETESKEFLTKISEGKEKTGFIVNVKDGKPVFLHRTTAEYFCGRWFARNPNKYTELLNNKKYLPEEVDYYMSCKLKNQHKLFTTILTLPDGQEIESALGVFKSELNILDPLKRSALHYAELTGNILAARYLLYNGLVTYEMGKFCKIVPYGAVGGELSIFWLNTVLLKYKESGTTATHLISYLMCWFNGDADYLLLHNSKHSSLHTAILKRNKEEIAKLLNSEDINSRNVLGLTPLHLAVFAGDVDTVEILGARGADYRNDNVCGMYPHQLLLLDSIQERMFNILDKQYSYFIEDFRSALEVLTEDYAPQGLLLHDAIQKKDLERVKHLINNEGCDINQTDSKGRTLLHVAMAGKTQKEVLVVGALRGINYVQDSKGLFPHDYIYHHFYPYYFMPLGYAFACGLELLPEEDRKIFNKDIENIVCKDNMFNRCDEFLKGIWWRLRF